MVALESIMIFQTNDSRNFALTEYQENTLGFKGVKMWNKLYMHITIRLGLAWIDTFFL